MTPSRHVAVIGAGPAGLMAAETLAGRGARVTVYERMPSVGRKFLLAGRGGLNLTHSEAFARLPRPLWRCGAAAASPRSRRFRRPSTQAWCEALGQPTFVGSSGRVFPKSFKTSPLLRAWLRRLDGAGVAFRLRHRWTGWDERGDLMFESTGERVTAAAGRHRAGARRRKLAAARLRTEHGWTRSREPVSRSRRCGRPIAALSPNGPISSAIGSRDSR